MKVNHPGNLIVLSAADISITGDVLRCNPTQPKERCKMKWHLSGFRLAILFGLTFTILVLLPPAGLANQATPNSITNTFFKQLMDGDINGAYDRLFAGSSIPANKPQAVSFLKKQTASALSLYGKPLGYELVREERFGKALARMVYILHTEMTPTVWEFFFYKPKDHWFLVNIVFNDKFDLLDAKNR